MSDNQPTAEQVVRAAMTEWRGGYDPRPTLPAAVVAALRANPSALADLNGGEWVPLNNICGFHDGEAHIFVPREATDG